jgi:flagellar assembly protein FliH
LLLDQLLSSVRAEVGARIAAAEDEMIALSHAVVCRILGDRLVTREGLADAMRQAVRAAAANGDLTVRLHPEDLAQLQVDPTAAEFLDRSAGKLHWIADDQVGRGGCVMTSSEGTLDARLETQLDSLRRVLLRTASSTERAC